MNRKGIAHFYPRPISCVWTVGLFWPGSVHWQDGCWNLDVIWSAVENAGRLSDDWAKVRWGLGCFYGLVMLMESLLSLGRRGLTWVRGWRWSKPGVSELD